MPQVAHYTYRIPVVGHVAAGQPTLAQEEIIERLYSLDIILSVGFRVRSPRGTQFRRGANTTLKEREQDAFS
ncbi:MAG: virulence RhuM family protein [Selenomonadaceae bacterium]|nr:virulence RhuM family protein [Selenomonadaceae bacterium]